MRSFVRQLIIQVIMSCLSVCMASDCDRLVDHPQLLRQVARPPLHSSQTRIKGFVESMSPTVRGWICMRGYPNQRLKRRLIVQVMMRQSNEIVGWAEPSVYRADVVKAYTGLCSSSDRHGFEITHLLNKFGRPLGPTTVKEVRFELFLMTSGPLSELHSVPLQSQTTSNQTSTCLCCVFGPVDFERNGGLFIESTAARGQMDEAAERQNRAKEPEVITEDGIRYAREPSTAGAQTRILGTLKADVLVVNSSPEASLASRCWARRSHGRSLPSTDRRSSTTQMAPPFIEVVYGANILSFARQKTMSIIEAQLESLELVGLFQPEHAHVHVVLSYIFTTGTNSACSDAERSGPLSTRRDQADASKAMALIGEQVRRRNGTLYSRMGENLHEWPALHRLWRLACKSPDNLFLYFHTKGSTRDLYPDTRRALSEMAFFKEVVASWRSVRSLFALLLPRVQHAGIAPSVGGFEWFNFFWVMGSHASKTVQPIVNTRRHYYENWLALEASASQCSLANGTHSSSIFRSMCLLTAQEVAAMENVGVLRGRGCESSLNLYDCNVGSCGDAHWALAIARWAEHAMSEELAKLLGTPLPPKPSPPLPPKPSLPPTPSLLYSRMERLPRPATTVASALSQDRRPQQNEHMRMYLTPCLANVEDVSMRPALIANKVGNPMKRSDKCNSHSCEDACIRATERACALYMCCALSTGVRLMPSAAS